MNERKSLQREARKSRERSKRLVEFDHVVMIADGKPDPDGDRFNIDDVRFADEVPVRFGEFVVGKARLRAVGTNVVGSFRLKRKKLPGSIHGMFPAINGLGEKDSSGLFNGFRISSIGLWPANTDRRIHPLPTPQGSQGNR